MNTLDQIVTMIRAKAEILYKQKNHLLLLSCIVVFITTYMLIFPARTLDATEASEQGGIDVPVSLEALEPETNINESVNTENSDQSSSETLDEIHEDYNSKEDIGPSDESKVSDIVDDATETIDADKQSETEDVPSEDSGAVDVKSADSIDDSSAARDNAVHELTYNSRNCTITVSYNDEACIPDGASLKVSEILPKNKDYQEYYNQTLDAAGLAQDTDKSAEPELIRVFDIEIWANGNKIEPKDEVTVSIKMTDTPENKDAKPTVVHFAEEGSEVIPVTEPKDEDADIQFATSGFSVYAVVYSVDFSYEINGEKFEFSMDGADSVSLRELIEKLHVYEASGVDAESSLNMFMEDIDSVTFSDESLLVPVKVEEDSKVGKIKTDLGLFPTYPLGLSQKEVLALNAVEYMAGDWVLISMKAFDTVETLTVEMKTGESFSINVTDAQDAQMVGDEVLTVTNPAGTTIDLFDYWIIDQETVGRDAWGDLNQGWGGHGDEDGLNGTGNNKGINSSTSDAEHGHALKFSPAWEGTVFNGSKDGYYGPWSSLNSNGRDGLNSYTGSGDPFQGIVQGTLSNGYPILTNNDTIGSTGESLAYLFDPEINHTGKASYPGADRLLYVDKDGYYTYDSRDYKADYKSDGTFRLTEQTSDDGEIRGFWPFGTQNFWVGMHVNTQFSIPVNGQVLNPRGEYKDMQFEFSGDDDTWLYIDGILVGDGGGIHNRTEIDINFAEGKATVTGEKAGGHSGHFEVVQYLDDLFKAAGKYNDDDWEDIGDGSGHKRFKAGTYHTFDMFYLERGGGESNLYIHYNLVSTADFTAHKSYKGYDDEDVLQRNEFRFELVGLDGKYRSVWSEEAGDYVLVKEDDTSRAVMPHASSSGAGTTVSPYYNDNTSTGMSDGSTVRSQTYITGNVEDGNVNFGTAEISEQDMHDCDEKNPPVYRYIVREIVPDDAVNGDGVTWEDATDEQKAAGGFVKDSVIYDGTIYYMTGRITSWTETDASGREFTRYGLSKTYYTDDTYTTKKADITFIDFRNEYTPDVSDFDFNKVNVNEEPVEGAVFQLFRDSACKIPAKNSNNENITATSDGQGKVFFTNVRTGIYFMKEVSAPDPYEVNPTVYRVTVSKQGSHMSVNSDQNNTPVTEVVNTKPGDITVTKKWLDANGNEFSGAGYPATIQLRRYKTVRTGPEPETHNVTLHFHFPYAHWLPDKQHQTFGPYVITGNSVIIHWTVGGCQFFWEGDPDTGTYSRQITDSSGDNLVQLPLDQDLDLHFYGNQNWAAANLNEPSVDGAFDDSKELIIDTDFPSSSEEAKATQTLTAASHMHAWSIGAGSEYDFPAFNDVGDYLYYVVELNEDGEPVEINEDTGSGMTLVSIEYKPEKIEDKGITHGLVTVTNKLSAPQSIKLDIRKTDDAKDSTNYLAGAVFALEYKVNGTTWVKANSVEGIEIPQLDNNGQFTVPESGIKLEGLIDGQYRLKEISAPQDYVIIEPYPVQFTVSAGTISNTDGTIDGVRYTAATDTEDAVFIIPNTPGVELPITGGIGTTIFYVLGSILVISGAIYFVSRRRVANK